MEGNKQDELQQGHICCSKTGTNKSLAEETIYFFGETDIIEEFTKDLGVLMLNDASFSLQMEKVASKV